MHDPSVDAEVARLQNIAANALPLDYFDRLATAYAVTPDDALRTARRVLSDRFAEVLAGPR